MDIFLADINTGLWVFSIALLVFFISILAFIFGLTNWMAGYLKEDRKKMKMGMWFFFPSLLILFCIFLWMFLSE